MSFFKNIHAYILSALVCLTLSVEAQVKAGYAPELDSLSEAMQRATDPVEQVRLANEMTDWYLRNGKDATQSLVDAKRLIASLESSGVDYDEQKLNYQKCTTLLNHSYACVTSKDVQGLYDSLVQLDSIASMEILRAPEHQMEQYNNWKFEAEQNIAYCYFVEGMVEDAFLALDGAVKNAASMKMLEWVGSAYKKQAEMYFETQDYRKAVEYYKLGIKNLEKSGKRDGVLRMCYLGLGNALVRSNEVKEVVEIYTQAIELFQKANDQNGIASCYYNLAQLYHRVEDYEYASRNAKKAADSYRSQKNFSDLADCLDILTSSAYRKGDFAGMIDNALEALKLRNQAGDKYAALVSNDVLVFAYLSAARHLDEFNEGDYYVHQAHMFSQRTVMNEMSNFNKLKSYSTLRAFLDAKANGGNVMWHTGRGTSMNLLSLRTNKMAESGRQQVLQSKIAKFENANQRQTIEQQEKSIRVARMRFWMVLASSFIMVILVFYVYHVSRKQRISNQVLQERNEQIEAQQATLNKQIEETKSLMGFKERMTNMIIHDLKTPLNGIMSAEFIDDELLKNEIVRHSANEMMNLVQNVLDFYKSQETGMVVRARKVNFASVVESEIRNIRFILDEKMLQLKFEDTKLPSFNADPQLFRRVISNVFSNAAKYSPQGGTIEVKARVENEKDIRIEISNQGPPIPDDAVELIFQPFGQAGGGKDLGKASSTGLGLTFCQMAVTAHGGSIGVTPNKIDGAEFWIYLPNCVV